MIERTNTESILPNEDIDEIDVSTCTIDAEAVKVAEKTIVELDARGEEALLEYVSSTTSPPGERLVLDRDELRSAVDRLDPETVA